MFLAISVEERRPGDKKRAVVLLSGGLDSATACAMAANDGLELYCLSFDYGQTLKGELDCAGKLARHYGAKDHKILRLDLASIGGSALTDPSIDIPMDRDENEMADIPPSYVPARNTIFLSIALAWAEVLDADHIYIGVNAVDYSGYPDCRPDFIEAYQFMTDRATRRGVEGSPIRIATPLLHLSKSGIVRRGLELGVPYQYTWSCYTGGENPCGRCDSCVLRAKAFREAGVADPALAE